MEMSTLLDIALKHNASDIHISPNSVPIFRVDGDLKSLADLPSLNSDQTKELIYNLLNKEEQEIFEKTLEYDFAFLVPYLGGFRGNVFHTTEGISGAFRLIPNEVPTLDQLDLPEIFKKILTSHNGLILVTGPTGSGKSTTLAAMINYINENFSKHILTIEDPIEFIHYSQKSLVHQRQLFRDTHSFSAALRAALREDPDVILIGEMRDLETIRIALTAAETGHLVLGTLHTRSAPQSVNRIVDMFGAEEKNIVRNMLSESLRAVITQTLLKREEKGRVAAFEIMLGSPAIRNLIREDKIAQMYSVIQTSANVGMTTLEQYLGVLEKKGYILKDVKKENSSETEKLEF